MLVRRYTRSKDSDQIFAIWVNHLEMIVRPYCEQRERSAICQRIWMSLSPSRVAAPRG